MDYKIREMKPDEYYLLSDFIYEAIFQEDPLDPVPRTILQEPSISIYIKDFGRLPDDYCCCAEVNGIIAGAAWVRNIQGFGSVDDQTPEFAVSLYKEYRGYGIGTALMEAMLQLLRENHYHKVSLAVQKKNYAFHMYRNVGFEVVDQNKEEYIMICDLTPPQQ